VRRGGLYLVGEQGPEYFQPGADGAIHPNSVYRAISDPVGGLSGAFQGASGPAPRLPALAPTASAGPAAGGIQVSLTIQNPVVDSQERLEQLKREVLEAAASQFAVAVNRLLLAEG
jgi:hypothetical protein